jgi:hypothetical protein
VRKGDALACFLFNVAMEEVVTDTEIQMIGTVRYKPVQILAYVDAIVVVCRTLPTMKAAFELLDKAAKKMGLTVNGRKKMDSCQSSKSSCVQKVTILEYALE